MIHAMIAAADGNDFLLGGAVGAGVGWTFAYFVVRWALDKQYRNVEKLTEHVANNTDATTLLVLSSKIAEAHPAIKEEANRIREAEAKLRKRKEESEP